MRRGDRDQIRGGEKGKQARTLQQEQEPHAHQPSGRRATAGFLLNLCKLSVLRVKILRENGDVPLHLSSNDVQTFARSLWYSKEDICINNLLRACFRVSSSCAVDESCAFFADKSDRIILIRTERQRVLMHLQPGFKRGRWKYLLHCVCESLLANPACRIIPLDTVVTFFIYFD